MCLRLLGLHRGYPCAPRPLVVRLRRWLLLEHIANPVLLRRLLVVLLLLLQLLQHRRKQRRA